VEVVASLSQGRTAAAQCGLFTHKSVPLIFEPPCTSSGMISLCKWLLGMPDRHTKQSLTETNHTRWCINTIRSPDDEHCDARCI